MKRRKLYRILLCAALLSASGASAKGQSFSESHAKVSLVSEDNSLSPGHTAWLGVLFDLEKGWHTYWVNPGDSGEAPKIQWQLPPGFRAGGIRWPVPTRIGTGTIIDYGYEGRVLLAVPVAIPANYQPGKPLTLSADIRYLVCSNVCIPAKAHATLTIPSGSAGDAAARRQLFATARSSWPQPMPANWKAQAKDAGGRIVLSIDTGMRETPTALYPLDEDAIDNASLPVMTPTEHGATIALKKSDLATKPITALKGVVVMASGRAVEVSAAVTRGH